MYDNALYPFAIKMLQYLYSLSWYGRISKTHQASIFKIDAVTEVGHLYSFFN